MTSPHVMRYNILICVFFHLVRSCSQLPRLVGMLQSPDVDVRITCGEVLALMYELARDIDPDYEGDDVYGLCETLKQLATDSNKFRAKKDRRQQRSSFREVLRAIEEGDSPCYRVQVSSLI